MIQGTIISPLKCLTCSSSPTLCYNTLEPHDITKLALITFVTTQVSANHIYAIPYEYLVSTEVDSTHIAKHILAYPIQSTKSRVSNLP